jgi:hypothetical protein
MAVLYVAHSKQMAGWGADVGLGKNLFLVDLADNLEAATAFLAGKPCGADDWVVVKSQESDRIDRELVQTKLSAREKRVDPGLYPRLRGFSGLFKVKPENVENHIMVKKALEGLSPSALKIKNADIALYLLHNAAK